MSTENEAHVPRQHLAEEPVGRTVVEPRETDIDVHTGEDRQDPVRWGSVWAGLVVTLATFILLELVFFSLGWLTFAQDESGTTAGLVTALIGLVAFLLGGMVAGATSIWRGAREGAVHGVLVWALGVVGILFITLFGGGALFGAASDIFVQTASLQNIPEVQAAEALSTARDAAGWAIAGLVASLVAATVGGVLGVKTGSKQGR